MRILELIVYVVTKRTPLYCSEGYFLSIPCRSVVLGPTPSRSFLVRAIHALWNPNKPGECWHCYNTVENGRAEEARSVLKSDGITGNAINKIDVVVCNQ